MTKQKNKKSGPKLQKLRETYLRILTEKLGADRAEDIMRYADAVMKFYLEPHFVNFRGDHIHTNTIVYGAEKARRMFQLADARIKFYCPPKDTKYNN